MPILIGAKKNGAEAQAVFPPNDTPKLDKKGIKQVQQIIGSILYYARAVNMMVLMALSTIAVDQTKATEQTMERCTQLLDYLVHNADTKVHFCALDMILNIHSDASYLLEAKVRSRACGHFFMEWMPKNGEPIQLNGAFHVDTTIMRFVAASATEAELGTLYHNCQTGITFRLTLAEMGHPQPKTPVHCNNATAVGIANNSIKRQQSRSMDMHFFWVGDKVAQEVYNLSWHPGQENLADYQSKHHVAPHHVSVQPWYLHMENSPQFLPRAQKPSALKGCVGNLKNGYVHNVPLPRASRIQSASHVTCYGAITRDGSTPLHSTPLAYVPLYVHSTSLAYIPAAPRIQSACHVTCYGAVTHNGSTPLHSTPLHSTCIQTYVCTFHSTYIRSSGSTDTERRSRN
jgi:hypothetical protein